MMIDQERFFDSHVSKPPSLTLADEFQSNCASVSGRGWLRVSGRDRVKKPATKPRTPISDIGTPAPRLDCMGRGGSVTTYTSK